MQVTSLLSRESDHEHHHHHHDHDHEHGPGCGCGHEHASVPLGYTLVGVVFVLNAFIVDWLFQSGDKVASISAFIGAVILGIPIVVTAVRDLKAGNLSINELVAI